MKVASIAYLSFLLISLGSVSLVHAETAREAEHQQALRVLMGDFEQTQRALKKKPGDLKPGTKYILQADDTLSQLAMHSYGNTPLNLEIIEKIIVDKNPNGFFRGNGNYILVGETIIIPTVDDIRNYVFSYSNGNKFDHIPQDKWIRYPN